MHCFSWYGLWGDNIILIPNSIKAKIGINKKKMLNLSYLIYYTLLYNWLWYPLPIYIVWVKRIFLTNSLKLSNYFPNIIFSFISCKVLSSFGSVAKSIKLFSNKVKKGTINKKWAK